MKLENIRTRKKKKSKEEYDYELKEFHKYDLLLNKFISEAEQIQEFMHFFQSKYRHGFNLRVTQYLWLLRQEIKLAKNFFLEKEESP